ncbi:hypothetical protein KQW07_10505 [Pseudomonas aeruginosa]|uniref:hypothetical protein n=1 Tax=Pseudomonas aeruginosa TaxID=287 RepID=UPI001C1DFE52|nr:hypothetical protein [Pseudomonas aeruginosa]MBU5934836.1 hypothetical protein [Pseudomonas aeruginosa]HBO4917244.1 hypothetical protein [Pseudomonas aeruginosa]
MSKNIVLNISNILMDEENPRHDRINGQKEILNWHVEHLGSKLILLMRSLAENGQSDIDKVLVTPVREVAGKYVVKEGNRRVAALKLLSDPSLCDDELFRRRIQSVNVTDQLSFDIECVNITDQRRVAWLMGLRHLGEQGGVGTSKWGAVEKDRHTQDVLGGNRYWRSLYFIDYAKLHGLITDQQAARLNERITTLDRLISNKDFKATLGVAYKDRSVLLTIPEDIHRLLLGGVLEKISLPDFKVKEVYDSDNKFDFLTRVVEQAKITQEKTAQGSKDEQGSKRPKSESEGKGQAASSNHATSDQGIRAAAEDERARLIEKQRPKKTRKDPDPSKRDKLFVGSISIPTVESKCSRLYNQIDSLKLSEHGLVVACAARALVDISMQIYIDQFSLVPAEKRNRFGQIPLPDMIKVCAEHLFSNGQISKDLKNSILSGEVSNPNSFASPQALHSFLHGRYQNSMEGLKAAWESCYEELLRSSWRAVKANKG